jgi:hypothetical protein
MPTDAEASRQHRRAPGGPSVRNWAAPVGEEESGDDGNARGGVARDRRGGLRQVATHMGDERADVAFLYVVTGKVLDFGDRAFDSAHANGSGPSML